LGVETKTFAALVPHPAVAYDPEQLAAFSHPHSIFFLSSKF